MKIKVSEATSLQLDWLMAKCEGQPTYWHEFDKCRYMGEGLGNKGDYPYSPSTDWAQGGPIIDRNGIATERKIIEGTTDHEWKAYVPYVHAYGPTPLVAAMRCYVASKLGDDVEVPDELT